MQKLKYRNLTEVIEKEINEVDEKRKTVQGQSSLILTPG
jgi:putative transposon-encoded protein